VLWIGLIVALGATENGVTLVRTYKNASLIEISTDGQLILARLKPKKVADCPGHVPYCLADVLAVYEAGTGESLGELVAKGGCNFGLTGFLRGNIVFAIERDWKSPPVRVEWNIGSGSRSRVGLAAQSDTPLLCPADDSRIISGIIDHAATSYQLQVLGPSGVVQALQQPKLPFVRNGVNSVRNGVSLPILLADNCATWRSHDSYLMEGADGNEGLYWVSLHPDAPARFCRAFPKREFAITSFRRTVR
jgi:hypothetical protein